MAFGVSVLPDAQDVLPKLNAVLNLPAIVALKHGYEKLLWPVEKPKEWIVFSLHDQVFLEVGLDAGDASADGDFRIIVAGLRRRGILNADGFHPQPEKL